jgi:proline dehydrogenase
MSGILIRCNFLSNDLTHDRIFKDSLEQLSQWSGNNPIKLVRGAYLTQEPPDKVIQLKQEADDMYDTAVQRLLTQKHNSVMLATHNHRSVLKATQLLRDNYSEIMRRDRTITFAQLYGMGDDITYGLVREMKSLNVPVSKVSVVKYIPYGSLNEVLPYLVRRAEENRGMLGGSILEREALYDEVKRRIASHFGISTKLTEIRSDKE